MALGDHEPAIDAIERAVVDRSQMMGYLNVDPGLAPILAEPRVRDLSRRIGSRLSPGVARRHRAAIMRGSFAEAWPVHPVPLERRDRLT